MRTRNAIRFLRKTALAEGVSFLVLVFICMPLKYGLGMPGPVKYAGWAHGVLIVLLCVLLLRVLIIAKWPFGRAALVFAASLVPFGPFLIDKRMRGYEAEQAV